MSLADNKVYNGATFDGFVERPRQQFNVASNWFLTLGGRAHNVKVGYDFQNLESGSQFDFPNRQFYIAESYNPVTRTPVFGPNSSREDYDSGAVDLDGQGPRDLRARQDGAERSPVARSRAALGTQTG